MNVQLVKIIDFWLKSVEQSIVESRKIVSAIDLKSDAVVDLIGPRRSGKSSIMKLIIKNLKLKDDFLFINFEDPFFIENNSPEIIEELIETFIAYFNPNLRYLFFDEIQEINYWERALRKLRDGANYKIFVTGSSSKLLSREISTLLTGRHLTYEVFPLSFEEFLNFRKVKYAVKDLLVNEKKLQKQFTDYCAIGGFPEVVVSGKVELLKSYFFDLIQKDIVKRYEVREVEVLERMAYYLMSNSGKIHSVRSISKLYEVSSNVAAKYIEYLKEAFLFFELPQFSFSVKTQQKSLKKIYACDVGMAEAVAFSFSKDFGRKLENLVFLELNRRFENIFYYKTAHNLEVDFLVVSDRDEKNLIQVCYDLEDDSTCRREVKALVEAMKELKLNKGLILSSDQQGEIVTEQGVIKVVPVWAWLLGGELMF